MKQNIKIEQLKQLNKSQLQKLWKLIHCPYLIRIAYAEKYKFDVSKEDYKNAAYNLNIGKMIEILELSYPTLHIDKHLEIHDSLQKKDYYEVFQQGSGSSFGDALCDALWEATKKILEK